MTSWAGFFSLIVLQILTATIFLAYLLALLSPSLNHSHFVVLYLFCGCAHTIRTRLNGSSLRCVH